MNDVVSSIQGIIALAALITGVLCGRPKSAALWGAIIGTVCAAVLLAVILGSNVQNLDVPRFVGHLFGLIGGCALFALLGYGIKRLFRKSPAAPSA